MFLGDLQTKDVVNINDGKNLGRIVDVEIDSEGKIVNIVIEKRKFFKRFFNSGSQINIMYQEINKIGDDVILISI
ncbi:MAG: YlmC/YmxH family sporulation protein [Bacilli bacterium]|nr:YlmC/YmxH family sporulation protein [Bacilli bacterium]